MESEKHSGDYEHDPEHDSGFDDQPLGEHGRGLFDHGDPYEEQGVYGELGFDDVDEELGSDALEEY